VRSIPGRLIRRAPAGIQTFPLDITFAALMVPSGILFFVGLTSSRALEVLPLWARYLWAACLVVGGIAWAAGALSAVRSNSHVVIRYVPVMVFGLSLTSAACFVYGIAIILTSGWAGVIAASGFFTIGAGTYVRRTVLIAGLSEGS
jgi:hypothetical protein